MARVPITVMDFLCERCAYEWIPRDIDQEPKNCPKCKSPYWNRPRKRGAMMTYEAFRDRVRNTIRDAGKPLTWTEIRTTARLPQAFPNNQWVHRLEEDISLTRSKDSSGIIHWGLKDANNGDTTERTENAKRSASRSASKQG